MYSPRCLVKIAIAVLVMGLSAPEMCSAQTPPPPEVAGMRTVLPVIPDLEPRPGEGTDRDEQWRTGRVDREQLPVAEFLEKPVSPRVLVDMVRKHLPTNV